MPRMRVRGYLSALPAVAKRQAEERSYKTYITDSLFYKAKGQYLTARWADLIKRRVDRRSPDEIAADVIKNAGLKFNSGEEGGDT